LVNGVRRGHGGRLSFVGLPPGGAGPGRPGDVERHPMEPRGNGLLLTDAGSLACQDEEGGLEGVLGVVLVAQHLPADAEHQRPVLLEQRGKGALVPLGDEALEQLAVRGAAVPLRVDAVAEEPQNARQTPAGHALPPSHAPVTFSEYFSTPPRPPLAHLCPRPPAPRPAPPPPPFRKAQVGPGTEPPGVVPRGRRLSACPSGRR